MTKQTETNQMERRTITLKELRVVDGLSDNGGEPAIEGYASVFDSWSEELGGNSPFREKVVKGAFEETIQVDDIRALFNHDPNYVLGRNKAGTLTLEEDDKGLKVKIIPPNTTWAKDLLIMSSIERIPHSVCVYAGNVTGLTSNSFTFNSSLTSVLSS